MLFTTALLKIALYWAEVVLSKLSNVKMLKGCPKLPVMYDMSVTRSIFRAVSVQPSL